MEIIPGSSIGSPAGPRQPERQALGMPVRSGDGCAWYPLHDVPLRYEIAGTAYQDVVPVSQGFARVWQGTQAASDVADVHEWAPTQRWVLFSLPARLTLPLVGVGRWYVCPEAAWGALSGSMNALKYGYITSAGGMRRAQLLRQIACIPFVSGNVYRLLLPGGTLTPENARAGIDQMVADHGNLYFHYGHQLGLLNQWTLAITAAAGTLAGGHNYVTPDGPAATTPLNNVLGMAFDQHGDVLFGDGFPANADNAVRMTGVLGGGGGGGAGPYDPTTVATINTAAIPAYRTAVYPQLRKLNRTTNQISTLNLEFDYPGYTISSGQHIPLQGICGMTVAADGTLYVYIDNGFLIALNGFVIPNLGTSGARYFPPTNTTTMPVHIDAIVKFAPGATLGTVIRGDLWFDVVVAWLIGRNSFLVGPNRATGGIAQDPVGNIYWLNNAQATIEKYDPNTGQVTTYAGILNQPEGVGWKVVSPPTATYGAFTTYPGTTAGIYRYVGSSQSPAPINTGDGGLALSAGLSQFMTGLVIANGKMYFQNNNGGSIRAIDMTTNIISTVTGQSSHGVGSAPADNSPLDQFLFKTASDGLGTDPCGNIYALQGGNLPLYRLGCPNPCAT